MDKPKKVFLVSPLEWGLGHSTRLSVVIDELLDQGQEVIIAADGLPYQFFSQRYPDIRMIRIPVKPIHYAATRAGFFLTLFLQLPAVMRSVRKAAAIIDQVVQEVKPDFMISDNRYGFRHPDVPSIFITHQLGPMPPKPWQWLQPLMRRIHLYVLRKYNYLWIADNADQPFTGSLSHYHGRDKRISHVGVLSWMKRYANQQPANLPPYDMLVMLSGPEPQRTNLENKLMKLLAPLTDKRIVFLRGLPKGKDQQSKPETFGHIHWWNHLPGDEIGRYIHGIPVIICRAGSSTLFDLAVFNRPALMIPAPGQTEQEYVTRYLHRMKRGMRVKESQLTTALIQSYQPANYSHSRLQTEDQLKMTIDQLLQQGQNQADASPDQP